VINAEIDKVDATTKPDPGRVTIRRLNREEYNNTVRDLLGVHSRPADDFPQDDSGYALTTSEMCSRSRRAHGKYVAAAEKVARRAVFGADPLKPTLTRLSPSKSHTSSRIKPPI
jgi:hypothetical protein